MSICTLALLGDLNVLTAVLATAVPPIIGAIAYARLGKEWSSETDNCSKPPALSALTGYGSRMWIGSLSGILLSKLDQVIMNPLAGPHQLGLYAVAANVADIVLVVNNAVRDVTFATEARGESTARVQQAARMSLALSLMAAVVVSATMPAWVGLAFGDGFHASVLPAVVLMFTYAVGVPGSVAGAGLSGLGRPGLRSTSLVAGCIVNVIAMALLVPQFGAAGAAVATLAGSVVASNMNIAFLHRLRGAPVSGFFLMRRSDVHAVIGLVRTMRVRSQSVLAGKPE
jgi:O-antigen/teichoic acid export membrane protein